MPPEMAVLIALNSVSRCPHRLIFAFKSDVLAAPSKYVFAYTLLYDASAFAIASFREFLYFSIATLSERSIMPSLKAVSVKFLSESAVDWASLAAVRASCLAESISA